MTCVRVVVLLALGCSVEVTGGASTDGSDDGTESEGPSSGTAPTTSSTSSSASTSDSEASSASEPSTSDASSTTASSGDTSSSGSTGDPIEEPSAIVTGIFGLTTIALDADRVYWGETGAVVASIRAVSRDDGEVDILAGSEPYPPEGLVVDDTHAYWFHYFTVRRAPLDGGAAEDVGTLPSTVSAIGLDGDFVYVATWPDAPDEAGFHRLDKSGGDPTPLTETPATCEGTILVEGGELVCIGYDPYGGGEGLVVLPVEGGSPGFIDELFANGNGNFLVRDGDDFYWSRGAFCSSRCYDGQVRRATFGENTPSNELLPFGTNIFSGFAVGGDSMFYSEDTPSLRRLPKDGGEEEFFGEYPLISTPTLIVADADAAYVVNDLAITQDIVEFPQ